MNYEQPPPYPGPSPSAPGYPAPGYPVPGYPVQGYPTQAYAPQGYPAYTEQPNPNPAFTNLHPGAANPYTPQPGYQGYPAGPHPQFGWQNAPAMAPVYGEPPKNTVYLVDDGRHGSSGDSTCLTACWTALCCCCLLDMLT